MVGTLAKVAQSHNALHSLVVMLNQTAIFLGISPKLRVHKVTADQVHVAETTLKEIKVAAVVTEGVELLHRHKNAVGGAQKAWEHLGKFKVKYADAIPATSWGEFSSLAQDAASENTAASMALVLLTPKREKPETWTSPSKPRGASPPSAGVPSLQRAQSSQSLSSPGRAVSERGGDQGVKKLRKL